MKDNLRWLEDMNLTLFNALTDETHKGNNAESEQKSGQHDEQRSLLLLLKPEIRKLCDVLLLPVSNMFSLC